MSGENSKRVIGVKQSSARWGFYELRLKTGDGAGVLLVLVLVRVLDAPEFEEEDENEDGDEANPQLALTRFESHSPMAGRLIGLA